MLKILEHRGPDAAGISFDQQAIIKPKASELDAHSAAAPVAVGRNLLSIPKFCEEPKNVFCFPRIFTIACDGYVYANSREAFPTQENMAGKPACEVISKAFEDQSRNDATAVVKELLRRTYGEYALAVVYDGGIVLGRDLVGTKPLYIGTNRDLLGFASERKALWRVGITETSTLRPGCMGLITPEGIMVDNVLSFKSTSTLVPEMDKAVGSISERIYEACRLRVENLAKIGVLFSGGLDSSLLSAILSNLNMDVILYTASVEGFNEVQVADSTALKLGLKLRIKEIRLDELEDYLERTIYAIERYGIIDVGVAIPFYASSELAQQDGLRTVFSGQGCDEVFGGYTRYLRVLSRGGYSELQRVILHDTLNMAEANLERDDAAVMANSVEHRTPFADFKLLEEGLKISPLLKISGPKDGLRKNVLRKVAMSMGIEESVAGRTKKAVQYGSGVDKALRFISKRREKNVNSYLKENFLTERLRAIRN